VATHRGGSLGVEHPGRFNRDRALRASCWAAARREGQGGWMQSNTEGKGSVLKTRQYRYSEYRLVFRSNSNS
jgi:hypothetical protein